MEIETQSLMKICGENVELLVFGLNLQNCLDMTFAINALKKNIPAIQAYNCNYFPYQTINYNKSFHEKVLKRRLKSIITDLVFENYKRIKENKPIILLLFCVDLEKNGEKITLNIQKIAQSGKSAYSDFTDSELRRCYHHYCDPETQFIVKKMIKFISVKQQGVSSKYQLEEVPAFWESSEWKWLWHKRQQERARFFSENGHMQNSKRNGTWKNELTRAISDYNHPKIEMPTISSKL